MVATYITYFENLAVSHKDIRHQTGSDVDPGVKRFATFNTEDVISKQLRTKVGYPLLALELYEWQLEGDNMYNAKAAHAGAFSVLKHVDRNVVDDELQAYILTEAIILDLIQKIIYDHYGPEKDHCTSPFQHININMNIIPIGPVFDWEFGYRCEFSFRPKLERNLTAAPAAGTFL